MEKGNTMAEKSDIENQTYVLLSRIVFNCKELQQEIITAKNLLSKQVKIIERYPTGYLFDEDLEELNYLRQHFTTFLEWYKQDTSKDQVVTPSPAAAKMKK